MPGSLQGRAPGWVIRGQLEVSLSLGPSQRRSRDHFRDLSLRGEADGEAKNRGYYRPQDAGNPKKYHESFLAGSMPTSQPGGRRCATEIEVAVSLEDLPLFAL